jgi:hypothetical protein
MHGLIDDNPKSACNGTMVAARDWAGLILQAFAFMVVFLVGPVKDAIAPGGVPALLVSVLPCGLVQFVGGQELDLALLI